MLDCNSTLNSFLSVLFVIFLFFCSFQVVLICVLLVKCSNYTLKNNHLCPINYNQGNPYITKFRFLDNLRHEKNVVFGSLHYCLVLSFIRLLMSAKFKNQMETRNNQFITSYSIFMLLDGRTFLKKVSVVLFSNHTLICPL